MEPRGRTTGLMGAAAATLCLLASCSSGAAGSAEATAASVPGIPESADAPVAGAPAGELPRPAHVMVVIFENEDADDVLGSREAPYLTSLAASGASLTNSHGETHPSQPNYLALFSGSTHGVTDNECPLELSGDNLASQLDAAGLSFTGWSEDLPSVGYTGCHSGDYARKHNPWVNFPDLPAEVNQPFSAMPSDYGELPTVSVVVPDLCHDMHDCGIAEGDAWAEEHLAPYATWAEDHDSLLIVTFDEDSGTDDNQIATIVAGAGVRPSATTDQHVDHYGLLRTLEDMYGLPPLGEAAAAAPITGIWDAAGS
jgi:acid phosphatase